MIGTKTKLSKKYAKATEIPIKLYQGYSETELNKWGNTLGFLSCTGCYVELLAPAFSLSLITCFLPCNWAVPPTNAGLCFTAPNYKPGHFSWPMGCG